AQCVYVAVVRVDRDISGHRHALDLTLDNRIRQIGVLGGIGVERTYRANGSAGGVILGHLSIRALIQVCGVQLQHQRPPRRVLHQARPVDRAIEHGHVIVGV
uniref:Uncharacterized protein n=1 Tax=Mola mola TaxID=94237 RepID=A0A3Q3VQW6_MOLML